MKQIFTLESTDSQLIQHCQLPQLNELFSKPMRHSWHQYRIVGKLSKRTFTLGDKVRVRVLRASMEQKQIDYELILNDIA